MAYRIHPDDLAADGGDDGGKRHANSAPTPPSFGVKHPEKGELWVLQTSTPVYESEQSMLWYG